MYEPDFLNFQFVGYRPKYMDPRTDSDISLVHEYIGPGKYQGSLVTLSYELYLKTI